jgi:kynurenine formamidase
MRLAWIFLLLVLSAPAAAQTAARAKWWPSEYGTEDQKGAGNRLTPDKALAATKLIKTGEIIDMTRVVEDTMPLFALTPHGRKYVEAVLAGEGGGPSYGPLGENALAWNEDFMAGHITQNGTQFDSLAHMGTRYVNEKGEAEIRYYNGFRHADIAYGQGFRKLGAEHAPPFFTPGLLVDIRGLLGRQMNAGEEISVDQIKAALARQGLKESDIKPGDALFYNTGWGEYWKVDNAKFNSAAPGLSPAAGDWVVTKKVVLVGTDNWAVEAIPNPDPKLFAPNHQKFLVENGIYIMENLDFSALIAKQAWRFAFSFRPIPFKGATGSPAGAFAIR